MDVGILLLRVAVGLTLTAHGAQKLFGWFNGPGRDGFAGYLETLGFRRARTFSWIGGLAEFLGGLLLAVGFMTPLAAAAIIGVMVAAAVAVHWTNGFFNSDGGFELPLLLATAAASITIAGPGAYAVDTALALPITSPMWAAAGILAGVVAATAVLALRHLDRRRSGGAIRPQAA